ncbi:MAG: type II toxin-antitoxin system PemK/MazF family toxin [Bacteroidota bacterium]
MTSKRDYRRGDVVKVRLDPVEGSEQGGTRPVLVVSNDVLNETLPVLTVAVITSRKVERIFPTEVLISPPEGGLRKPSKVLLYQLRTISKDRVSGKMGEIGQGTLSAVEQALCIALDLPW